MNRHETQAAKDHLPLFIRNMLWFMAESVNEKSLIQKFSLTSVHDNDKEYQIIVHTQEEPAYNNTFRFECGSAVDIEAIIICDGYDSIMALATEKIGEYSST